MAIPRKGSPVEEIVGWFIDMGYTPKTITANKDNMLEKILRTHCIESHIFRNEYAAQTGTETLQSKMKGLQPNISYGPLSYDQKVRIRDHHQDHTVTELSQWVKSSKANVQLAKMGNFKVPAARKEIVNDRPYGPLSYEEQRHIRDNHPDGNTRALSEEYNTHYNSVYRAQRGEFPEHHATRAKRLQNKHRPFGPLTYEEKVDIRDNRTDENATQLAKEYNTNYGNITNAQRGQFKSRQPQSRTLLETHKLLLEGLMGKQWLIYRPTANDNEEVGLLDDIIKELLK